MFFSFNFKENYYSKCRKEEIEVLVVCTKAKRKIEIIGEGDSLLRAPA